MTFSQKTQLRTRFNRLPEKTREDIVIAYERHKRACKRLGIPVDPLWLNDAVVEAEVFQGREAIASEIVM